jgi:lipoyl(octanoyl) transferase
MVSRPTKPTSQRPREFAAHFHLLGCVDYEDCLSLQRRLAYDALTRADGRVVVLICEHPPLITIGRAGSRRHVRLTGAELAERQLAVRYIGRGGGAILHRPGQLAIYPVVPLDWHGWTVGGYLRRLQTALTEVLAELQIRPQSAPGTCSLFGRSGVLAAFGVAVRSGVATQGAFLNVNPDMRDFGRVETSAGQPMSSLLSQRPVPVKMTAVRAALVARLAAALGCERHHLHTGHPHLAELPAGDQLREPAA